MKYIDAEKLIANLERQNVDKKVIQPLIRIIDSLSEELDKSLEEAFRAEAAKDILCAMVSGGYGQGRVQAQAQLAKEYADELIKQLNEE